MASLFQEEKSTVEMAHAKFLRSIIVDKLQKGGKWTSSKWADEFRILRKRVGEDRIAAALDWLDKNCQAMDFLPIETASSFRRHFNWLETLMEEDKERHVQISDDAETITEELLQLKWSRISSTKDLKAAVQISLDNYEQFFQKVRSLYRTRKSEYEKQYSGETRRTDFYLSFLESFFKGYCKSAGHVVEQWMRRVHRNFDQWQEWNGNVMAQVWSFGNERIRRDALAWTRQQGYLDEDWDRFVQDVTDEN